MRIRDPWFKKICESYENPPVFFKGDKLPGFPPDQIQVNTTGQAGVETLKEAFIFYEDCLHAFEELDCAARPSDKLLDFGVGWGRITRFFLKEIPLSNLYGLDVTSDFVDICKDTFQTENFVNCDPYPPANMDDRTFQFIVGYSVFSHLSEDACATWMNEFYRLLKPGGIVAMTTRGRPFLDFCEGLQGKGHAGYLEGLSKMFDDFDDARNRYDKGEFVHSNRKGVNGGGAMNETFYGESFIPDSYARDKYSDQFTLERFLFDPKRQTHPILFFKKK